MSDKKYVKIRLKDGAAPFEDIMSVVDAMMMCVKQLGDPALWNHKVTFRGENTVIIEWEKAPEELHAELNRIFRK